MRVLIERESWVGRSISRSKGEESASNTGTSGVRAVWGNWGKEKAVEIETGAK